MNMGRNPHRSASSSPKKTGGNPESGEQLKSKAESGSELKDLSTVADSARNELLMSGEMTPLAKSVGNRRERMDEVRRKVAEGYYNRDEIRHEVAERLADNMNP